MYSIKRAVRGYRYVYQSKGAARPKENILDFAGIFDREDVAIIEEIIRERRGPSTRTVLAVS
jgi:hypothetical protein